MLSHNHFVVFTHLWINSISIKCRRWAYHLSETQSKLVLACVARQERRGRLSRHLDYQSRSGSAAAPPLFFRRSSFTSHPHRSIAGKGARSSRKGWTRHAQSDVTQSMLHSTPCGTPDCPTSSISQLLCDPSPLLLAPPRLPLPRRSTSPIAPLSIETAPVEQLQRSFARPITRRFHSGYHRGAHSLAECETPLWRVRLPRHTSLQ